MDSQHSFVICAYKESEYLEECILSLKHQSVSSAIIMVTSTPNQWIQSLSERYKLPLYVNEGESGITQDWNFGLRQVKTRYATIAHQDDVYEKDYTEQMLAGMRRERRPLIGFSDYCELRNGDKVYDTSMLRIKRIMLWPLRWKCCWRWRFLRRRVLSLGDPICCPSVVFCMDYLEQPVFQHGFRSCEDWEAWEKLSKENGSFVYIHKPLMCHRIHEESATTAILRDHARVEENYIMYCKFWPKCIAGIINKIYTKSEDSNTL